MTNIHKDGPCESKGQVHENEGGYHWSDAETFATRGKYEQESKQSKYIREVGMIDTREGQTITTEGNTQGREGNLKQEES